jgi:hypothetical protein
MEKPILKHSNLKREDMKELLEGYPGKRSQGDLTEDEMNELICRQNTDKFHEELRKGFDLKKKDMKPRIYISGAISGLNTEERRKAFRRVQDKYESEGWTVFNPFDNGLPDESPTSLHMRRDLAVLTNEDIPFQAIYMMAGWNHSAGCWTEFQAALAIGLEVIFEQVGFPVRFE